jgi:hypothetical protein
MTPIWMFEGTQELDPVAERNLVERRFSALAAAVREHEARVRRQISGARPCDLTLYRRMRQILAEEARSNGPARARPGMAGEPSR